MAVHRIRQTQDRAASRVPDLVYLLSKQGRRYPNTFANTKRAHPIPLPPSRALLKVDQLRRHMEVFFDDYDLLLTPTMAVPAFPVDQRPAEIAGRKVEPFWGYLPFTYPINMSGQTASSVPCGFSSDGMPIGLHIIGPKGAEAKVLQASAAFEEAQPWQDKRPPLV